MVHFLDHESVACIKSNLGNGLKSIGCCQFNCRGRWLANFFIHQQAKWQEGIGSRNNLRTGHHWHHHPHHHPLHGVKMRSPR